METTGKYVGLDVHKDTTVVVVAEAGRSGVLTAAGGAGGALYRSPKIMQRSRASAKGRTVKFGPLTAQKNAYDQVAMTTHPSLQKTAQKLRDQLLDRYLARPRTSQKRRDHEDELGKLSLSDLVTLWSAKRCRAASIVRYIKRAAYPDEKLRDLLFAYGLSPKKRRERRQKPAATS